MTLPPDTRKRLEFLVRVVDKEIKHLNYASQQAFAAPLTQQRVESLEQNPELALKIEAFTSRYQLKHFAASLMTQVNNLLEE